MSSSSAGHTTCKLAGITTACGSHAPFNPRFSANAEPHAAHLFLRFVLSQARGATGIRRVALVTDHYPIVLAQRAENGFRGIGRGYFLNGLYAYTNELFHAHGIRVVFFFLDGASNPADVVSRNFGEEVGDGAIAVRSAEGMALPRLWSTACPICEK
ncbi:hypothetical protein NESM_000883100 [Novymonas esmeraldas]|uniref:Uncharacterized protein n=1 Tax=Novymonas esmeraldas TaxID=1808958 RepID=A0AAW0EXQ1_9TRYP